MNERFKHQRKQANHGKNRDVNFFLLRAYDKNKSHDK